MRKITVWVAAMATVPGLLLAGCSTIGSEATPSAPANASFNDADVEFVQSMIPHHEQAVMMATMAKTGASDTAVKELAADIKVAQEPEINQMREWLNEWGIEEADSQGHAAMGHGSAGMDMPGMMTEEQMTGLDGTSGNAFDEMFMTMMIGHHEGAIDMAETVKAEGNDPEVAAMADDIIKAQAAEIAIMQDWLKS